MLASDQELIVACNSPSSGVSKDEETSEHNQDNSSSWRILRVVVVKAEMPDGSKNQKADHHPDASSNKRLASTVVFDKVETNESDAKVDTVEDHLRDEGADCDRLEDRSTVVEEIVGAGELLEHLQTHPECDSVSDSRSSEHGDNLRDWTALDFALSNNLGLNLFHLYDD